MRPAIIFEYNAESGEESYRLLEKLGYGLFDLDQRALALQKAPLHDVLAIPKT